jgi:hypothetical protein
MTQVETTTPDPAVDQVAILRRFRAMLGFFIFGLVMSGITAFPLQRELGTVVAVRGLEQVSPANARNSFDHWILTVRDGLRDSYGRHPWLAYGTDWLAFAHIVIAVFFIGPFVDGRGAQNRTEKSRLKIPGFALKPPQLMVERRRCACEHQNTRHP